ncbi:MAG: D-Ala-D-Ala carboxypeptidase family metallohydrolase [Pseudomonadota bacterium]
MRNNLTDLSAARAWHRAIAMVMVLAAAFGLSVSGASAALHSTAGSNQAAIFEAAAGTNQHKRAVQHDFLVHQSAKRYVGLSEHSAGDTPKSGVRYASYEETSPYTAGRYWYGPKSKQKIYKKKYTKKRKYSKKRYTKKKRKKKKRYVAKKRKSKASKKVYTAKSSQFTVDKITGQTRPKIVLPTQLDPKEKVRLAALGPQSFDLEPQKKKSLTGGGVRWIASSGCLKPSLRNKVYRVAANYGRVTVNSTCRSKKHNRRVGGARRSQHLTGNAVDFRVHGNWRGAAAFLRSHPGGYKHYGGGRFHIDGGSRRRW